MAPGWRPVNSLGLQYLFVLTLMIAASLILGTTAVKADNVLVVCLIGVGGLIAAVLVEPDPPRMGALTLAWLAAAVVAVFAVPTFWSLVLAHRGVQVTAT